MSRTLARAAAAGLRASGRIGATPAALPPRRIALPMPAVPIPR